MTSDKNYFYLTVQFTIIDRPKMCILIYLLFYSKYYLLKFTIFIRGVYREKVSFWYNKFNSLKNKYIY